MNQKSGQTDVEVRVFRAGVPDRALARTAVTGIHGRTIRGDEVVTSLNGYRLTQPHTRRPQFLLYEIDVAEPWRRRGIGARLVRSFTDEARRHEAFGLWVVTDRENSAAMAMYHTCDLTHSDLQDVVFSREF